MSDEPITPVRLQGITVTSMSQNDFIDFCFPEYDDPMPTAPACQVALSCNACHDCPDLERK